jgi:hypothetical protein
LLSPREQHGPRRSGYWPPAHDPVLALLDWLPEHFDTDAELVAGLLNIPAIEAQQLLQELEGCLTSATGPLESMNSYGFFATGS